MKENHTNLSVADILRSSINDLRKSDIGVYQKVIDFADKGLLEQHQTSGTLKALADSLVAMPAGGEIDNEGK